MVRRCYYYTMTDNKKMETLTLSENEIIWNGRVYRYAKDEGEEYVGRTEIAKMEGLWTKRNGKPIPNVSNMYETSRWGAIHFPNFEIEKAAHGAKPWKRREVRAWLNIPPEKRKEMYVEYMKEKEDE